MAKAKKFNMRKVQRETRSAMERSIVLIGNEARKFFIDNFRKQGFDDKHVEKWQPRKKADKRAGRAILVKTGDLRRSIIRQPVNKAQLKVKISSDLPYSRIHNDGLMGRAWGKHSFKMPKRQFMGDSWNLNEKMKGVIVRQLNKVFKQ